MRSRCAGAAVIAAITAVALSACGSSGGGSTTTRAATATSTTTTSRTTTVSTTTTTATVAGVRPCVAADLAVSFLGQQGATGHGELGFLVRNKSSHSCHTFGFPGVLFLDKARRPLPTRSTRTTHDFFGRAPKARIVLAPGAVASFRLGVTHGAVPNEPCTTAYALQVIPPDDTATIRVAMRGGAYECRTATVSPLRPGRSAYP